MIRSECYSLIDDMVIILKSHFYMYGFGSENMHSKLNYFWNLLLRKNLMNLCIVKAWWKF